MGFPIEGKALDPAATVSGSLADLIQNTHDRQTTRADVYPSLAAGATVVSANTDWGLGTLATVVAASTITSAFVITAVSIESCDKNAVFQLELYSGAGDDPVGVIRFAVSGGFFGNQVYRFTSAEIAANARVRAALASSDGLANQATITISIRYQEL
jgi:hypothetical protein